MSGLRWTDESRESKNSAQACIYEICIEVQGTHTQWGISDTYHEDRIWGKNAIARISDGGGWLFSTYLCSGKAVERNEELGSIIGLNTLSLCPGLFLFEFISAYGHSYVQYIRVYQLKFFLALARVHNFSEAHHSLQSSKNPRAPVISRGTYFASYCQPYLHAVAHECSAICLWRKYNMATAIHFLY